MTDASAESRTAAIGSSPRRPRLPSALIDAAAEAVDAIIEAAQIVHGPAPLDEKLAWVLERAGDFAGATLAAYVELTASGDEFWTMAGSSAFDTVGAPAQAEIIRHTLRHGQVARVGPLVRGWADAGPAVPPVTHILAVAVPRHAGRPHGALLLGTTDDAGFRDTAADAVRALAAHLGVALDNLATVRRMAELEAARREVVYQLQEAVRPPMPAVHDTELGVYYLPADPQAPTGGDLYDWQVLPDGDLHIVVVDVLGKGVAATKDALAVTHVLRLLVLDGCPLDGLVARADALVTAQSPELVATLIVGRYTPSTGTLRLAGAGHPPLYLIKADREVRPVYAPGIPIGWPGAGTTEVVTVTLDRSDTAIFYTDGLIEATKNIVDGLANLERAAAETSRYPAPHLARALVERALAGAERRDDSLALVLRRRTPPPTAATPLGPFEYRFSPTLANVPLVRHFLADWLSHQEVDRVDADDLLLVASELCSNAVRSASGRPGALALRARSDGTSIVVEVEDDGGGLEWPIRSSDDVPDPEAEQGRGLYLVEALTDELTVTSEGGRTLVRVTKRAVLPPAG